MTVVATVVLPGNPLFNINDHVFKRYWKRKSRSTHLMENSLNRLNYIPAASVFERFLNFGMGNPRDVTLNISQTLCVTNHEQEDGYIQWLPGRNFLQSKMLLNWFLYIASLKINGLIMTFVSISDPDNVFIVDPVASVIPPNESRLFTVRFR